MQLTIEARVVLRVVIQGTIEARSGSNTLVEELEMNSKPLKLVFGGRDRVDFGTVRPRGQIPGPRPILYSKSTISNVVWSQLLTALSQFPAEQRTRAV